MSKASRTDPGTINRIKAVLAAKRLSAATLSKRAEIPYRSLQNYLLGRHAVPADIIARIADALEISADWILFGRSNLDPLIIEDCLGLIEDLRGLAKLKPHSPEAAAMFRSWYDKFYAERFFAPQRDKARLDDEIKARRRRGRRRARRLPQ